MFSKLMTARRFAPLFWCQFFSALNDNLVKQALVILIAFTLVSTGSGVLIPLAGAVFIAPFFFLSALGGELADRHDKAYIAERVKFYEMGVAVIAVAGFVLQSIPVLFVALALFGVIGALFGPVKYGILPDQLKPEELSAGNALVEAATFLAILGGTLAAGFIAGEKSNPWIVATVVMGLAVLCWLSATLIPKAKAAAPELVITRNPLVSTFALLRELKTDNRIWVGGHIVSWFGPSAALRCTRQPTRIRTGLGWSGWRVSVV